MENHACGVALWGMGEKLFFLCIPIPRRLWYNNGAGREALKKK